MWPIKIYTNHVLTWTRSTIQSRKTYSPMIHSHKLFTFPLGNAFFPWVTDNWAPASSPAATFPRSIFVIIYLACREAVLASGGASCVCVRCLSIERHAGCMKNNSWNVFDLYCSCAPASTLGVYIWSQSSLYTLHASEWVCVFDIALLKVGLTAGTRGAATYFSWSRASITMKEAAACVIILASCVSSCAAAAWVKRCAREAKRNVGATFCGVSAGLECGLGWKIVFPPLG